MLTTPQNTWSLNNTGVGAGTQGQATLAPHPAGLTHVVTGFLVTVAALLGIAVTEFVYQILDGSTVIWEGALTLNGNAGDRDQCAMENLQLAGTPGNQLTIQFTAGLANVVQRVNLIGYDAQ